MADAKKGKSKKKDSKKQSNIEEYVKCLLELHKLQDVLLNCLKKALENHHRNTR